MKCQVVEFGLLDLTAKLCLAPENVRIRLGVKIGVRIGVTIGVRLGVRLG
jgi:hypothetical protein